MNIRALLLWFNCVVFFIGGSSSVAQDREIVSASVPMGSIYIIPEVINLGSECSTNGKLPILPGAVIDAVNICDPEKWRATPMIVKECSGKSFPILGVRFKDKHGLVFAESVAFSKQYFHIRLFGTLEDAHGNRSDVVAIERMEWCTTNAPASADSELPSDACREARQFAVEFDYGTPLNNKILTNGFSFYVRLAGKPRDDFDFEKVNNDISDSFGRALTHWVSALKDNDALLTPAIRNFINTRTLTSSSGYKLLLPPQVVRLHCPHAATFIVELNFGENETFPSKSPYLTLAKARVEGRTIALNNRDVACFRTIPEMTDGQFALRDDHCVNLLPIMIHELGHAFGIEHISSANGWALMNHVLSDQATFPNRLDVAALVSVLERSIMGANPGELEFHETDGLQAPPDWTWERK